MQEAVHIILKLARQVEGEYVYIFPVAAFRSKEKCQEFLSGYSYQPTEVIQDVPCLIEIGVHWDIPVNDIA